MPRHQTRQVRIFALYNNPVEGQHFGVVKSGTWAEVLAYLPFSLRCAGARALFIEDSATGALRPLMA